MQKNKVIAIAVLMLIIGLALGSVLGGKGDRGRSGQYGYGKDRGGQMMNSHMMPNGEMMSNGTESMSMADMM